ncbi:hypothetical protein P7K49_014169 [Saguinus oedipus]|uniref:Uncharacterized protein n=1 Tax=Saguinus oedipus TaxID=9490 RepID=A0ABQ9VI12_SAGOE|nr:hypothetical protein P7K49_014169 [Saguinus oedipus]
MPSASASRKSQEKPREIMDAAEVGFLLSRAWDDRPLGRAALREGGGRAGPSGSLLARSPQATGLGSGRLEPSPQQLSQTPPDRVSRGIIRQFGLLEACPRAAPEVGARHHT